jgi:hypothetical protein
VKDLKENPTPMGFGFRKYIPSKYESPKLLLTLESKGDCSAGNDICDDAWFLRAIMPSSARMA